MLQLQSKKYKHLFEEARPFGLPFFNEKPQKTKNKNYQKSSENQYRHLYFLLFLRKTHIYFSEPKEKSPLKYRRPFLCRYGYLLILSYK